MSLYHVWVKLEENYEVEADSEEEAFLLASECAMSGGSWEMEVELLEEDTEKEEN